MALLWPVQTSVEAAQRTLLGAHLENAGALAPMQQASCLALRESPMVTLLLF